MGCASGKTSNPNKNPNGNNKNVNFSNKLESFINWKSIKSQLESTTSKPKSSKCSKQYNSN